LASLSKLAERLKQQKIETAKLRRQSERRLEQAKSLARRSSSGLHTLEKKLEDTREHLGDINAEFTHILARKESLERLIKMAHDRLNQEMETKEQAQIELENADTEDAKQQASERLAQITEKIQELKSEIKQRESTAQKLVDVIEEQKKSKSKTSQRIHQQVQSRPTLVKMIKKGETATEQLKRKVASATRKEASLNKNLQKVTEKLEELMAKRRREAAKKAAIKRAAKRKALALKRKRAAKKRALALKRKRAALKRKLALKKRMAKLKKARKAAKPKKAKKTTKKSKKKSRR
jgi:chromosome segregation ATPase